MRARILHFNAPLPDEVIKKRPQDVDLKVDGSRRTQPLTFAYHLTASSVLVVIYISAGNCLNVFLTPCQPVKVAEHFAVALKSSRFGR